MIKRKSGFTLLEVMVALAILSIAVSTLLVIRNEAVEESIKAVQFRQLQNLLEQKMTEVISGVERRRGGDFRKEGFEYYEWDVKKRQKVLSTKSPETQKEFSVKINEITVSVYHTENEEEKYVLQAEILAERPDNEEKK
ncbi:type II secretion system protein [Candidatus Uabimicrobium amorphum]|nr:type II secretion system protein [Candidatus Uabimicrobium amorphum]